MIDKADQKSRRDWPAGAAERRHDATDDRRSGAVLQQALLCRGLQCLPERTGRRGCRAGGVYPLPHQGSGEAHLKEPELEKTKDGRVLVHYGGTRLNITDRFDKNGVCYVKLVHGGHTHYMTVKRHGGYAISPDAYIAPERFNVSRPED
jgi:hypothetical protein